MRETQEGFPAQLKSGFACPRTGEAPGCGSRSRGLSDFSDWRKIPRGGKEECVRLSPQGRFGAQPLPKAVALGAERNPGRVSCTIQIWLCLSADRRSPRLRITRPGAYHCEQNCKPGSVSDSHLSRRTVAGTLQPPRERAGQAPGVEPPAPIPVLLRIEFTATDSLQPSGALLPHLSTLTSAAEL